MRFSEFLGCCLLASLAASLAAQQADPKSKPAADALEKYGKAYQSINQEFKKQHQELLKQLIADLTTARAAAIGKNDLDEAMVIVAKIKEAEKLQEQDQVVAVKVPEKFEVLAAYWGAQDGWVEVTKEVRAGVANGRLSMDSPNSMKFRPDPKFGVVKTLIVLYAINGKSAVAICPAGQRVSLPR